MRAPLLAVLVLLAPGLLAQNTSSSNDWATPAEQSNYRTTPDYTATMTYLWRIAAAKPQQVRIEPFGKTGEGRELDIVITSKDDVFDPEKLHAAKRTSCWCKTPFTPAKWMARTAASPCCVTW